MEASDKITSGLTSLGVTDLTDDEIMTILKGGTVGRITQTLAAKEQAEASNVRLAGLLGKYGIDETPTLAANQQALEEAQLTGLFEGDPTLASLAQTFGQSMATAELTGILEREDSEDLETLAKQAQDLAAELETAKLSGTLTAEDGTTVDTLQKQLQEAQLALEKSAQEIQRTALASEQFRFLTEQTGVVGVDGTLTAEGLGVDVSQLFTADG
jgi:hypothetical protein